MLLNIWQNSDLLRSGLLSLAFLFKPPLGHFIPIPFSVIISFGHVLNHFHIQLPLPLSFSFSFSCFFQFPSQFIFTAHCAALEESDREFGDSPAPLTNWEQLDRRERIQEKGAWQPGMGTQ